jgi:multiple sugar transport system permease protein
MFLVLIFPVFGAMYLSTHDFIGRKLTYVGFSKYPEAIFDPTTWHSLWVNVKFTALSVFFSLLMGLLLALVLDKQKWGRRFFRTVFTLPWPILSVVVGIIFVWMFNARYGVINEILVNIGVFNQYRSWLGEAKTALPIVLGASIWKESPFFMIMIVAAMQAIPREQYEAAAVDGATWWQELVYITLPNLKQIIMIATMLQIIWRFREFDLVAVMTQGGPNRATEVLAVLVYRYAFQFFRFGKGAAIAVLMSLVSLVFSIIYLRMLHRRDKEGA